MTHTDRPGPGSVPPRWTWKADGWRLGLVLLLAVTLRAYMIANTTLVSRDCVKFVRFALHLERPPAGQDRIDVIRTAEHPPAYPVAILAMSKVVRPLMGVPSGEATVESMALSAQLVSALAGVLLFVPFYFLTRRVFEANTACAAGLLFTALPVCVEVTSDGISDGLYLLTAITALWFAVRALEPDRPRSAFGFALGAGLCLGLGYLVRPDALIALAGIGVTLLGLVSIRLYRRATWRPPFVAGLGLVLGFAVLMGPYVALIGKLTNKPTGKGLIETFQGGDAQPSYFQRSSLNVGTVPLASWHDPATDGKRSKAGWALESLAAEYWKTAHYSLVIFAAIGLFAIRRRFSDPRVALLLIFALVYAVALWTLAWVAGYVSQRHTLPIALVSCVLGACAFPALGVWAVQLWHTRTLARFGLRSFSLLAGRRRARPVVRALRGASPWFLAAIWTGLLLTPSLPRDLYSLHSERAGHKPAGQWIKKYSDPGIELIDPFGWAEWYADRSLREWPVPQPYDGRPKYVVFEPNSKSPHSRLEWYEHAKKLTSDPGWSVEEKYKYPENAAPDDVKVAVYLCTPVKK
ncbi:MAG: glycosyltransferase family 39 protein [Zavarzinella sp.]|nr:glycosyltransferase family 39 protein [Zavarzinella sp.]